MTQQCVSWPSVTCHCFTFQCRMPPTPAPIFKRKHFHGFARFGIYNLLLPASAKCFAMKTRLMNSAVVISSLKKTFGYLFFFFFKGIEVYFNVLKLRSLVEVVTAATQSQGGRSSSGVTLVVLVTCC